MRDNLVFSKISFVKKLSTPTWPYKNECCEIAYPIRNMCWDLPSLKRTFFGNLSSYVGIWYFSHCLLLWQGIGTSVHFLEIKKSITHIILDRIKITSVRFLPITKHQSSVLNLRVERFIIHLRLLFSMPISALPNPHTSCVFVCSFVIHSPTHRLTHTVIECSLLWNLDLHWYIYFPY